MICYSFCVEHTNNNYFSRENELLQAHQKVIQKEETICVEVFLSSKNKYSSGSRQSSNWTMTAYAKFSCIRRDISAMCTIRNNRLKSVGERVFVRNHGNSMKVTKRNINDEIITCRAFGHLIKKFIIEFQRNKIKMAINFVEQHLHSDLEELELIHLRENNPGKAGERELGNFIRGLDNRFRNLKHLSIDYRNDEKWCSYIMAIPILQNAAAS